MRKLLSLLLIICLLLGLAACGSQPTDNQNPSGQTENSTPADTESDSAASNETESTGTDVRLAVLSGPTGVGAAKLMADNEAGLTANHYETTIEADNTVIVSMLSSDQVDIAAVATNVAANLYNKTNGAVQICALNTYGVLYILENGDSIQDIADLKGKTIYTTGQGANPEYVLNYILNQNGLTPGEDVIIEFEDAAEVTSKMASGSIDLCMLPVPAATAVLTKNTDVRSALDMTEEWNKIASSGSLTMGCVVVRTEFAKEHPEAVHAFLNEYQASIDYVKNNTQEASELVAQYKITDNAAIAAKAIPQCNLCFVAGDEIRTVIEPYYQVLLDADSASIGGQLPGDDFYYVQENQE